MANEALIVLKQRTANCFECI